MSGRPGIQEKSGPEDLPKEESEDVREEESGRVRPRVIIWKMLEGGQRSVLHFKDSYSNSVWAARDKFGMGRTVKIGESPVRPIGATRNSKQPRLPPIIIIDASPLLNSVSRLPAPLFQPFGKRQGTFDFSVLAALVVLLTHCRT
jgi:hypothetical protein